MWNFFGKSKKNRNLYLIISIFLLFILMGLRSYKIGSDTYSYCMNYYKTSSLSWSELLNQNLSLGNKNYGFFILNKLISMIFLKNYTFYLICISGIISFAMYEFILKFSKNYLMSLIILFSLGFIFFFMSGIKQTLAISFILLSYIKLQEKRYIVFVLMVIFAASFHNTAIITLILLVVHKLKNRKLYFFIVPVVIVFSIIFQRKIAYFFQNMVSSGKYAVYGTSYIAISNLTGLYIQCVIILTVFLLVGYRLKEDKELQFYIFIYSIGIFFQTLTPVIAEFFRISMYFNIIGCVLLPYAIFNSKYKQKKFISGAIILFFIFYFYVSSKDNLSLVPYEFFFY